MFLRIVLGILWARRAIVIIAVLASVAGGVYVALTATPRYQATARVILDYIKPDPITGAYVNSRMAETYTKTQLETVRDVQVAGRAAERLGLLDNLDLQTEFASTPNANAADFRPWVARRFIAATGVQAIPETNIMVISYAAQSREAALLFVEAVREAYLDALLAGKQANAAATANNLTRQAEQAQAELGQLEAARREFEDKGGTGPAMDAAKLADLVRTVRGLYFERPTYVPSMAKLATIDADIDRQSRVLGPNHPTLAAMKQARELVRAQVAQEQSVAAAQGAIAGMAERARQSELQAVKERVLSGRLTNLDLRLLDEQIERKREVLQSHRARAAEFRMLSAQRNAGATPLGQPEAKMIPAYPNPALIIGGTLFLGLLGGGFLAILIELLFQRLRSGRDLETAAAAPLLGVLPKPTKAQARRGGRRVRIRRASRKTEQKSAA